MKPGRTVLRVLVCCALLSLWGCGSGVQRVKQAPPGEPETVDPCARTSFLYPVTPRTRAPAPPRADSLYMAVVDGRDVNTVQSEAESRCADHFRKRYGAKFDPGRLNVRKDLLYIEARGDAATREVACYRCFLTCEYEEARDLEAFLQRYEAALDSALREVNRGNLPAALTGLLDTYDLLGEGLQAYLRTERLETERQALQGALNALLASVSLRFSPDALSVDGRGFQGVDLELAGTFRYMDRTVRASGLPVGLSVAGGTLSATRVVLEDGAGRVRFSGPGLRATNRITARLEPGEGLVRRLQGYPEFRDAYQGMMGRSAVCTVSVSHLTYGVLFDLGNALLRDTVREGLRLQGGEPAVFGPLDKTGPYRLRCRMTVRSVETTSETSPPVGRTVRATVTVQVYDGGGRLLDERTVGPAQGIGRSVAGEPYSHSAEYNALEKLKQPILTCLEERLSQP